MWISDTHNEEKGLREFNISRIYWRAVGDSVFMWMGDRRWTKEDREDSKVA